MDPMKRLGFFFGTKSLSAGPGEGTLGRSADELNDAQVPMLKTWAINCQQRGTLPT